MTDFAFVLVAEPGQIDHVARVLASHNAEQEHLSGHELSIDAELGVVVLGRPSGLEGRRDTLIAGIGQFPVEPLSGSGEMSVDRLAAAAQRACGAFAGVTVRRRDRRVLAIRDHFGQAPCYVGCSPGRVLMVSSSIAMVRELVDEPGVLDRRVVAALMVAEHGDAAATAFRDIRQVPPASIAELSLDGAVRHHTYWRITAERPLVTSAADASEELRSLLVGSVRSCLAGASRPAVQLSGGMDSSSVAVLAARNGAAGLVTLSNRFPGVPECDEGSFIAAVTEDLGGPHLERAGDSAGPLQALRSFSVHLPSPWMGPNFFLTEGLFDLARQAGADVMLDGFDGDSVLSHGFDGLLDRALAARWGDWSREALLLSANSGPTFLDSYRAYAEPVLADAWAAPRYGAVWRGVRQVAVGTPYSAPGLLRASLRRRWGRSFVSPPPHRGFLLPSLADELDVASAPSRLTEREAHIDRLTTAPWSAAFEALHVLGTTHGVVSRHPFMNPRLVELTTSLSPELKLRDGLTRRVLRDALADDLPTTTHRRTDKVSMSPAFVRGLLRSDAELLRTCADESLDRLGGLIDVAAARTSVDRLLSGGPIDMDELLAVWFAVAAAMWLEALGLSIG